MLVSLTKGLICKAWLPKYSKIWALVLDGLRGSEKSKRIQKDLSRSYIEGDQERLRRKEDEMMRRHGRPRKRRPRRLEGTADEKKRLQFLHFYKPEVVHVARNSSVVRTCKVQLWKMSQTRGLHCHSRGESGLLGHSVQWPLFAAEGWSCVWWEDQGRAGEDQPSLDLAKLVPGWLAAVERLAGQAEVFFDQTGSDRNNTVTYL